MSLRLHRRPRGLALLAAALGLVAGCRGERGSPPPPPEIPVRVNLVLHPQIHIDHPLDDLRDRVAVAAVRWLRAQTAPGLVVDPAQPLEIDIQVDLSEDLGRLVIQEELHLRHARTWPLEVKRRREVPIGKDGIDLAADLGDGVRTALGQLADMADLFRRDDRALLAVAERGEAPDDLRSLAVRILQERKSPAVLGALATLFPAAPPDVRLTILDAAATLATPHDLPGLLARVDGRRPEEVSHALRAAAMVGGPDAEEYAAWMATGHPERRVREEALEAYQQIVEALPPGDVVQLGLADGP